jgi:hypothetical protein
MRDAGVRAGAGRLPVPPFKGNDTGGIIAYPLATQAMPASSRSITAPTARW